MTSILPPFKARTYDFAEYVPAQNWIGGTWRDAAQGAKLEVTNPRHGRSMGTVPNSTAEDVAAAVAAARGGFATWSVTPMKERAQVLYRLKRLMERDFAELSWIASHENGKCVNQAEASVSKGIECLEMGISLPNMVAGGQLEVSRGITCRVVHEPLGICAGIAPFNFPVMVPMWMLPQALIAGNAFILKPSEQVPYSMMKLAALLDEAGLPDGVFNTVNGTREAVEGIVDHPEIKAVGFVGSSRVAQLVYERGCKVGRRMLCLGSAKNYLVVVPDAEPELVGTNVVASAFGTAGQRCMAAAVVIAVGDVDPIIDNIIEKARALRLGTDMGCVINQAAHERITGHIDQAEKMGARVRLDGRGARLEGFPGHWVGPTVLDNVTTDMPAATEEIFGPVLSIIRCANVDEALAIENASPYGNAASIYTTNGAVAEYCTRRFEAGMCGVNVGVPVPREPFAFGGWNGSKFGHGDMTGEDGYRFWTRPRKITSKWAEQPDQTWMS